MIPLTGSQVRLRVIQYVEADVPRLLSCAEIVMRAPSHCGHNPDPLNSWMVLPPSMMIIWPVT